MAYIIAFEGISGAGKTFYINKLKEKYKNNNRVVFIDELKDIEVDDEFPSAINSDIEEMYRKNRFFMTGMPNVETILLMASYVIKMEKIKRFIKDDMIIVLDRGLETIAVYQSIMMNELKGEVDDLLASYHNIKNAMLLFSPKIDKVIYLKGNYDEEIVRAEMRERKTYTDEERDILQMADNLYKEIAKDSNTYLVLDVKGDYWEDNMKRIEEVIDIKR